MLKSFKAFAYFQIQAEKISNKSYVASNLSILFKDIESTYSLQSVNCSCCVIKNKMPYDLSMNQSMKIISLQATQVFMDKLSIVSTIACSNSTHQKHLKRKKTKKEKSENNQNISQN